MIPMVFDAAWEAGWRTAPVNVTAWTRQFIVRRYGAESAHVASAYDALLAAAYTGREQPDTSSVEKVPEVRARVRACVCGGGGATWRCAVQSRSPCDSCHPRACR